MSLVHSLFGFLVHMPAHWWLSSFMIHLFFSANVAAALSAKKMAGHDMDAANMPCRDMSKLISDCTSIAHRQD